jgi:acylphosphatase
MKRLTAYISSSVQKVVYRGRVVQMANALGLKGIIENLNDGRVKIVAEGEEDKLGWFEEAIEIKIRLSRSHPSRSLILRLKASLIASIRPWAKGRPILDWTRESRF